MAAALRPGSVALLASALRPTAPVGAAAPARVVSLPTTSSSSSAGTSTIPRTPLPTRPALAPRLEAAVASVAGPQAVAPSRILPAPVQTRPGLMRSAFAASSPSLVRPGAGTDTPAAPYFDGPVYAAPAAFAPYSGGGGSSSSSWADGVDLDDNELAGTTNASFFQGIRRKQADIASITITGDRIVMDNFTYTAAVPEPEGYAMFLAGLGIMGVMARRRSGR